MRLRGDGPAWGSSGTRALAMGFVLLGLLMVVPQATALTVLNVTANDEGPPDSRADRFYWFDLEGWEGHNPTIVLVPGEEYEVRFHNNGTRWHNLHFGPPIAAIGELVPKDGHTTFRFTVPEDAAEHDGATYWCDPHDVINMGGLVSFNGSVPPPDRRLAMEYPSLTPNVAPLLPVVLATALLALMARHRGRGP